MSVQIDGFEEYADRLDALVEDAGSPDGEYELSFDELFTSRFMRVHTDGFDDFAQFLEESQWTVSSGEEFEQIPGDEFDQYVAAKTVFEDWESMLSTAARAWLMRKLEN